MVTSGECRTLNSSFLSKRLLTKFVLCWNPGEPSKIKSVFCSISQYSTSDLWKNICTKEGDLMDAIFNVTWTFRWFFLLKKLLRCTRSLTFTVFCELISKWFCQEKPYSKCPKLLLEQTCLMHCMIPVSKQFMCKRLQSKIFQLLTLKSESANKNGLLLSRYIM